MNSAAWDFTGLSSFLVFCLVSFLVFTSPGDDCFAFFLFPGSDLIALEFVLDRVFRFVCCRGGALFPEGSDFTSVLTIDSRVDLLVGLVDPSAEEEEEEDSAEDAAAAEERVTTIYNQSN